MSERHSISIRDRHGFERCVPVSRPVTIGRHSQCDIVLSDSMVSRTHLKVERVDGQWWVEDLGSSHGTYQGEDRVARTPWEVGATLRLADGAYFLTLKAEAALASEMNLHAILQTAQLLTGQMELEILLEQALDRLLAISGTDRGFIMLPEDGALEVKLQRNLSRDLEKDIHLSMSSVRTVFDSGEAVWIQNVASDEKLMSQQSVLDLQLKTILCLPLMAQGQCIGVIYLDSRSIVSEPVDRATFEAIVALCAIAIERTRLAEAGTRNQVLAAVGQVASSIVHDFKNALFVVQGHAQMLEILSEQLQERERVKHHCDEILGAVTRLSALSADVLDYAKVREPKREELRLDAFLKGLAEPLRRRAEEAGAQLAAEGPACTAALDRHRFCRVMENLLANAFDAVEGRPEPRVDLAWEATPSGVQIRVRDNGKGIPKRIQKRIFEPFFSHGKTKGTGLGMATVKKIVEEHGGTIEVCSEEEQGTEVRLFLPSLAARVQGDTTGQVQSLEARS